MTSTNAVARPHFLKSLDLQSVLQPELGGGQSGEAWPNAHTTSEGAGTTSQRAAATTSSLKHLLVRADHHAPPSGGGGAAGCERVGVLRTFPRRHQGGGHHRPCLPQRGPAGRAAGGGYRGRPVRPHLGPARLSPRLAGQPAGALLCSAVLCVCVRAWYGRRLARCCSPTAAWQSLGCAPTNGGTSQTAMALKQRLCCTMVDTLGRELMIRRQVTHRSMHLQRSGRRRPPAWSGRPPGEARALAWGGWPACGPLARQAVQIAPLHTG